ncbi:MAG: prepilin peptidase [Kiritimatiellae bacterium]|nr:prepilin peptidase [Kiritimatiellia bacterium]
MTDFLIGLSEEDATFLMRIIIGFVVCLGAIIGSFLNVCIYRIPMNQSVSRPRSHCFSCGKTILWYHNIPVLTWFILRGKCANCKAPISFRYPAIEAFTAILFLAVFQMWGNPGLFGLNTLSIPELIPFFWLFVASTVVNVMIDIDHRILLDRISIGGTLLTFVVAVAFPALHGSDVWYDGLLRSFCGALTGFGVGFVIAFLGERIFLQDAFGFGDVKWMMLFGALFGITALFWILLLSSFLGLLMGGGVLIYNRFKGYSDEQAVAIPFGPALGVTALAWLFWSNRMMRGFASVRDWVLLHDDLFMMTFIPLLLLMSGWLVFRIRRIRHYNREMMAMDEAETSLMPISDSEPTNENAHEHD